MLPAMANDFITIKKGPIEAPALYELLSIQGFEFDEAPYAFWRAKRPGCIVTFYQKGKVLIQGRDCAEVALMIDDAQATAIMHHDPTEEALKFHPTPKPEFWIGVDEAGKGDYFGPLVVAAAAVSRGQIELLAELGVTDSKKIPDPKIMRLASQLRSMCPVRKFALMPVKYNELYAKFKNLNRLLGWMHARTIEDALELEPRCTFAMSDQFAKDPRIITRNFKGPGKEIIFKQRTKGESDPAVAVASVYARAEFLWQMKSLSKVVGFRLPLGAGAPVLTAGKRLLNEGGVELLQRISKFHFANTKKLGIDLNG
jgi:ribonuclease HIII